MAPSGGKALAWIMVLVPHAAVAIAWWFWAQSDPPAGISSWRSSVLLVGLIAGTLNVVFFWGEALLKSPALADTRGKLKDSLWYASQFLIVSTVGLGFFGTGLVRVSVIAAGILGFFLWILGASSFIS